jgi:hypothetical protein
MEYTSEYDSTSGICIIRVTGNYRRPEDSDRLKLLVIEKSSEHGCNLFLVDLTQAEVSGGTTQTYEAANPKGEVARSLRKVKAAFVRQKLTQNDHFFENVAVNRGFKLQAFDTFDKAVEWLRGSK